MMHMVLAGIAMVFLLNGFHFVYCFSGVQRAYLGLYKGIVEESTVVASTTGEYLEKPMIFIARLNQLLSDYFLVELSPYCHTYSYSIDVPGSGHKRPILASKVVITMDAHIDDLHEFHKSAHFMIAEASTL